MNSSITGRILSRFLNSLPAVLLILSAHQTFAQVGTTIEASECIPRSDEPSLCSSEISWKNAPSDSCVFVAQNRTGNQEGPQFVFACSSAGKSLAPWIPSANPSSIRFWIAPRGNSAAKFAEIRPRVKAWISASSCTPLRDEPSLCNSTISWAGAPQNSCVFVATTPPGGREGAPQIFGCGTAASGEAPWLPATRPTTVRFWIAPRDIPTQTLAETRSWENANRALPRIRSTPCVVNSDDSSLCTSIISWDGAPSDSCVFVATKQEGGSESSPQIFGCATRWENGRAPWLRASDPSNARFWIAPRSRPWVELAEVRPGRTENSSVRTIPSGPSVSVSECVRRPSERSRCVVKALYSGVPANSRLLVGADSGDGCRSRGFTPDPNGDVCIDPRVLSAADSSGFAEISWMPAERVAREKWKFFLVQVNGESRSLVAESSVPAVVEPPAVIPATLPADTFTGKLFTGYQAWFNTPGDGTGKGWSHWGKRSAGSSPINARDFGVVSVEALPDVSEYPKSALADSELFDAKAGSFVKLFSSFSNETINLHLNWMKNYGIDGLFLQWFMIDSPAVRFEITKRVRQAAEKEGRLFSVMFDISGWLEHPKYSQKVVDWKVEGKRDFEKLTDDIKEQWKRLVDEGITQSSSYTRYKGRPLVSLWGLGFKHIFVYRNCWIDVPANCSDMHAEHFGTLIDWFQNNPDPKYRASVLGGLPRNWRTGVNFWEAGDSLGGRWRDAVYAKLDIVSPWTVGSYRNSDMLAEYVGSVVTEDRRLTSSRGQVYFPVISPGFSWSNLKRGDSSAQLTSFNPIPRNGGSWMWQQAKKLFSPKGSSGYIAMFDEVDEGTAIFKLRGKKDDQLLVEVNGGLERMGQIQFLGNDTDGFYGLPSDWYLRVASQIGWWMKSQNGMDSAPEQIPTLQAQPYRDPSL